MRVDVWSDIACPWCWLGKRHLEEALRREGLDDAVIDLRSFELDPLRGPTQPAREHLAQKLGGHARVDQIHARLVAMGHAAGLRYDFAAQRVANTFDAHRVHHLAKSRGVGAAVIERFMRAYHGEGADLADRATLRALAAEAGLDAAEVDDVLRSDAHAADVRADEDLARTLGIHGVPFVVLDGRLGVSGAQPIEVFQQAIRQARAASTAPARRAGIDASAEER